MSVSPRDAAPQRRCQSTRMRWTWSFCLMFWSSSRGLTRRSEKSSRVLGPGRESRRSWDSTRVSHHRTAARVQASCRGRAMVRHLLRSRDDCATGSPCSDSTSSISDALLRVRNYGTGPVAIAKGVRSSNGYLRHWRVRGSFSRRSASTRCCSMRTRWKPRRRLAGVGSRQTVGKGIADGE